MTRSRSINRFHRFLARQRRRGLRAVPQLRPEHQEREEQLDVSDRLLARSAQTELRNEMEALEDDSVDV